MGGINASVSKTLKGTNSIKSLKKELLMERSLSRTPTRTTRARSFPLKLEEMKKSESELTTTKGDPS
jgi:hypothetical protein